MLVNLAFCTLVCWGLSVQQPDFAKNLKPFIPPTGLAIVPSELASENLRSEIIAYGLRWAVAKSGADSEMAVTYRSKLVEVRTRIDRLSSILAASGDEALRAEADKLTEKRLREFREGPLQRLEHVRRLLDEADRQSAEREKTYKRRVDQLKEEYRNK